MISRRSFLHNMIGGVAAAAAVRQFPFRVYSFPSEIKLIKPEFPSLASGGLIEANAEWTWLGRVINTSFMIDKKYFQGGPANLYLKLDSDGRLNIKKMFRS